MYDDHLLLRVDPDRVDWRWFCMEVFPEIVERLGAYYAEGITDVERALDEHMRMVDENIHKGCDHDGRKTVYSFFTVHFIDEELCRRAFGLSPEQVVARVEDITERAELLNGGAFLVFSTELLKGDAQEALDKKVKVRLTPSHAR